MNKFSYNLYASVSRGKLNLRPVGQLHQYLLDNDLAGHYVTADREYGNVAFALERCVYPTIEGAAKLQLAKADGKRGEIELPFDQLSDDAKRLYELLEGSGRIYPLNVLVYGTGVLHVEWPIKQSALRSKSRPRIG